MKNEYIEDIQPKSNTSPDHKAGSKKSLLKIASDLFMTADEVLEHTIIPPALPVTYDKKPFWMQSMPERKGKYVYTGKLEWVFNTRGEETFRDEFMEWEL